MPHGQTPRLSHGETLARHLKEPLLGGNRLRLLDEGQETTAALLEAIEAAQDHVNLEIYSDEGPGIGPAVVHSLVQRNAKGVRVNFLCAGDATADTSSPMLETFREGGVRVCIHGGWGRRWAAFGRRFGSSLPPSGPRLVLIVDGRMAFIGGIQAGKTQTLSMEGPIVQRLQRVFMRHWQVQAGCSLPQARYYPPLSAVHDQRVALAGHEIGGSGNALFAALLAAIDNARHRILLAEPSALPSNALREALRCAALRGVAVDLLLTPTPGALSAWRGPGAQRANLLRDGVCVQARAPANVHAASGQTPIDAKVCVIDGEVLVLASSRGGWERRLRDVETDLVVLDAGIATKVEGLILSSLVFSRTSESLAAN